MPVTITIRAVPDDVHKTLLNKAKSRGMSLQQYALRVLTDAAEEQDSWDTIVAISQRLHAAGVRIPSGAEIAAEIRATRDA